MLVAIIVMSLQTRGTRTTTTGDVNIKFEFPDVSWNISHADIIEVTGFSRHMDMNCIFSKCTS